MERLCHRCGASAAEVPVYYLSTLKVCLCGYCRHVCSQDFTTPVVVPVAVTIPEKAMVQKTRRSRQWPHMRLVAVLAIALVLFVIISGSVEIAMHGFGFFVFRGPGVGATPGG